MSYPCSKEEAEATIKKIEDNPQFGTPGPAINNFPAMRGSRGGEMEHAKGKGTGKE